MRTYAEVVKATAHIPIPPSAVSLPKPTRNVLRIGGKEYAVYKAKKQKEKTRKEEEQRKKEEKAEREAMERAILDEKIVKKAISIKKKQIKKEKVLDEVSDDETPMEEIVPLIKGSMGLKTQEKIRPTKAPEVKPQPHAYIQPAPQFTLKFHK